MSYWPFFNMLTFVFNMVIHVPVTPIVFIDHLVGFVHHSQVTFSNDRNKGHVMSIDLRC